MGHIIKVSLFQSRFDFAGSHYRQTAKTVLPDHKKKDRSAKLFCKVKITLILCKTLDTPQGTKMITQGRKRQDKGYRKTNRTGPVSERTGQLAWACGGMGGVRV